MAQTTKPLLDRPNNVGTDDVERAMNPIKLVVERLEAECRDHPVATLSEGHLKAIAAAVLLQSRFAIIEGSNWKDKGWKVTLPSGKLKADLVKRPNANSLPSGKRTSPDLRIETDSGCIVLELQARCIVGSSSQLLSKNVRDDIERVKSDQAHAFIIVADRDIYDALRGIKKDSRGRKAKHSTEFSAIFPATEGLACAVEWSRPGRKAGGAETRASLHTASAGVERVVAVVMKDVEMDVPT